MDARNIRVLPVLDSERRCIGLLSVFKASKFFFPSLLEYICGKLHYPDDPNKRRVIAIVYQGPDAVTKIRALAGPTNPTQAREKNPGSAPSAVRSAIASPRRSPSVR